MNKKISIAEVPMHCTVNGIKYISYLLFKPSVRYEDICFNARTKLCEKCHQPECDLAGQKQMMMRCPYCGFSADTREDIIHHIIAKIEQEQLWTYNPPHSLVEGESYEVKKK